MSETRVDYQIEFHQAKADFAQAVQRQAAPPVTWADVIDEALCRVELGDLETQAQDLLQQVLSGQARPEKLLEVVR